MFLNRSTSLSTTLKKDYIPAAALQLNFNLAQVMTACVEKAKVIDCTLGLQLVNQIYTFTNY